MKDKLTLIAMRDVVPQEVHWLWKPYIPFGKITIIQGDGGGGKTTVVLAITAAATKGDLLPECEEALSPMNVIYQTAEDGLADTIKPRLLSLGADCDRIHVIDEGDSELSMLDERIEQAIIRTGAKLFILDPLQAYLGAGVDMHRANEIRPVFKRLGAVAERTGCAIIIVGHLNKSGSKSQYRGLGSIDIFAAARSVLTLGRINGAPNMKAFAHGKSNLAPEGQSIAFELNPETGFRWVGTHPITIDEILKGGAAADKEGVSEKAVALLEAELSDKVVSASEMFSKAKEQNISARTLKTAKAVLGVRTFKKGNQWLWTLMPEEGKE